MELGVLTGGLTDNIEDRHHNKPFSFLLNIPFTYLSSPCWAETHTLVFST